MSPEDRASLGPTANTIVDAVTIADPKAEKELQRQIAGYLRTREIYFGVQRMDKKSTNVVGLPDFVFPYYGKFVALEAKTPVGKQSPEQIEAQQKIEAAGGIYAVVRSVQEVAAVLNGMAGAALASETI